MNFIVFAMRHPITMMVVIVENGKASRTPIQVGLRGSELVEVLKKRVPNGKKVISRCGRISAALKSCPMTQHLSRMDRH
jgi:hypothetical protein